MGPARPGRVQPQPRRPTGHQQLRRRRSAPAECLRNLGRGHHVLRSGPLQFGPPQAPQRRLPRSAPRPPSRPDRYYPPIHRPLWRTPPGPADLHRYPPAKGRLGVFRPRNHRDRSRKTARRASNRHRIIALTGRYAQGMYKGCTRDKGASSAGSASGARASGSAQGRNEGRRR
jgi:hypothetical protein